MGWLKKSAPGISPPPCHLYRGAKVFPDNVQRGPEPEVVEIGLNAIIKIIILGHSFYLMKPPSA